MVEFFLFIGAFIVAFLFIVWKESRLDYIVSRERDFRESWCKDCEEKFTWWPEMASEGLNQCNGCYRIKYNFFKRLWMELKGGK